MNTPNLFISHSWSYGNHYDCLINKLNERGYFDFKNYSVPKNDPIHNASNDKELYDAIERQMKPATVIIIFAGMYATHSKWINIEIELAKKLGKPIIAIEYWGSERTSKVVKDNANIVVGWNIDPIVRAIRSFM